MEKSLRLRIVILGLAFVASDVSAQEPLISLKSPDFLASLGVNLHINYTDGAYAKIGSVTQAMRFLGIVHCRTGMPTFRNGAGVAGSAPLSSYVSLANGGVKFDFIVSSNIDGDLATARTILAARPGSIAAIEGFNEINNFPITYQGASGSAAAVSAQKALYKAVRADPGLKNIPVYDMTGAPATIGISGRADFANSHPYTHNALQPAPFISGGYKVYGAQPGQIPMVATEFGNFSLPRLWPLNKPYWEGYTMLGVDERTQAKIILNGFFEGARFGVGRSYAYELVDQKLDPKSNQPERHYGLFNNDFTPKLSATALHNLTNIVLGGASGVTAGAPVGYSVSALPSTVRMLRITQPNGGYILAFWNDVEFWKWNQYASHPVEAAPVNVMLALDRPAAVRIYDPLQGDQPSQNIDKAQAVRLAVPDHPILVSIVAK